MKKELSLSIFITVCVLVGAFILIPQPTTTPVSTQIPSTTTLPSSSSTNTVTLINVQKHNTISDCWLILNRKAYDVTSFIDQHPGGFVIVPFCGKDATNAYNAIRGGSGHSSRATQLLQSFYVGNVQ